jgi:hypothetical protein
MAQAPPKRNRYFQTAILDPTRRMSVLQHRECRSATPSLGLSPPTDTLKVIVGSDTLTQRTWHLPKALLARHSTSLAKLCHNPYRNEVTLTDLDARAFANFVDYMRSSIYSLNEHIPGFRAIRHNTLAYLLGAQLGAQEYADAAMRQLYMIFEPLARLPTSNARKSSIRADDVEFVWRRTQDGDGLRRLFGDAVASHWTQREACDVANTTGWKDVDLGFRESLKASVSVLAVRRGELLRPIGEYLNAATVVGQEIGIKQESRDEATSTGVGSAGVRRAFVRPRSMISTFTRTTSIDRRRRERAEEGVVGTVALSDWREGVVSILSGEEEEAVEDDWMILGAEAGAETSAE